MNAANEAIEERRTGRKVTVAEWATVSGYSVSAIETMIAEGMPLAVRGAPGKPHRLDTAQAIVWLRRREREREHARLRDLGAQDALAELGCAVDGETPGQSLKERMQLAKVRREEMEVEKMEGALVEQAVVEQVLANLVSTVRARLLALGPGLAARIAVCADEAECRKLIDERMYEALEELSQVEPTELVKE